MNVPALPRPGNPFVGRQRELASIRHLWSRGEHLVTLTGPGGIGKTRLALELASEHAPALFCDVSEALQPEEVASALARLLPRPPAAAENVAGVGVELAAIGDVLVVLDGFDQAVPQGAIAVTRWLTLAPRAFFLVTSRELLRLAGENVLEVPSLGVPSPLEPDSDAMQLALERLGRARVGYRPNADDLRALASLVCELDGFPLAIELAAARMSTLSPQALLERLTARFDVLRRVGGQAAGKHGALRTSLDDSWSLLDPFERSALAQCSVFAGGFTLASAEAIIDLSRLQGEAPPILDVIQRLREKSLLHTSGERLALYRSIRDYARMQLDGPAETTVRIRHASHYIGRAEAQGHAERAAERDNVLAAVEHLLSSQPMTVEDAILAVRGAYAMETMLRGRSRALFEKGGGLDRVLSLLATTNADPVWLDRARYLRANAEATEAHREDLTQVLRDARARGDRALEARILRSLGSADGRWGRFDTAVRGLSRAHETGRDAGERLVEAITLQSMGNVAREQGRFPEAEQHYERALSVCQAEGDVGREASVLTDVALLRVELGQLEGARADCLRAIGLHPDFGNGAHWVSALVLHERGDLEQAEREYERAIHVARDVGDEIKGIVARAHLAILRHERGDSRTAQALLLPLPAAARQLGYGRYEALFHGFLGTAQSVLDAVESSQRSFDAAASALPRGDRYAVAIHVLRAHVDLALFRKASLAGNTPAARAHRVAAEGRLVGAPATSDSYVLRLAQKLVSRAFPSDLPANVAACPSPVLRVERGGRWLYTLKGERFDVDTHRVVRALLCALVEARIRTPGSALSPSALCDAGWPGERVVPSAAKNRLHVSLTRLRKLGLRDIILRRDEGYLLDPNVAVAWTTS